MTLVVGKIEQLTTTPQTFEEWYCKHAHGKLGVDWLTVGSYKEMWESATKERDGQIATLSARVKELSEELQRMEQRALRAENESYNLGKVLEGVKRDREFLRSELATLRRNSVRENFPKIVCLCGSTRFASAMNVEAERLTLEGAIVVRPEVVAYSREKDQQFVKPEEKVKLDELHKRKIDLADEVFIVNVGGYIGDSTRSEVAYAVEHGKPVRWLEPDKAWTPAQQRRET